MRWAFAGIIGLLVVLWSQSSRGQQPPVAPPTESSRLPAAASPAAAPPTPAVEQPVAKPSSTPRPSPAVATAESATPSMPPKSESPPPDSPPIRQFEEASHRLFWLKDKAGNLVPVPGFSMEDFEDLLKQKFRGDQPDRTPRYSLQTVSIGGVVKGEFAEVTAVFRILVRDENWVRVPLRMDKAILQGAEKYRGPGRQFLHFESKGDGFVSWISGKAGQEHQLALNLLVPLSQIGDETRLRMLVPRAVSSELKLTIPQRDLAADASEGTTLLPLTADANGATTATVLGLGGDFELSWRKATGRPAEAQAILEVSGSILAKVESHGIDTEGRLRVACRSGVFDSFRVRLPKGADLISSNSSRYKVIPVASSGAPTGEDRKIVEIRLPAKTAGPVEVQLASRVSFDKAGPAGWCELTGYEVVDAVRGSGHREWGYVAIAAGSQWRVMFGALRGLRQVDDLPEQLRHDERVAGFEYFSQSFSLPLRAVPRKSRVSVEPEYLVLVEAGEVSLQAKLKYTVRTAEVSNLDVELPGWTVDEVGPDNLVAAVGALDPSGVLSIPLSQPMLAPIELSLRARRVLPPGTKSVSFELPRPRADLQAPATLVVLPGDDVELSPTPETMTGLVRQQAAPSMKLPTRQQEPLYFRGEPSKAVFAGRFVVHERKVGVAVASQINLDEQKAQVEQKLAYRIAYKPLDRLTLGIPRDLASADQFKILFEDKPLVPADLPEAKDASGAVTSLRKQVVLPPPSRIGLCELVVRYNLETTRLLPKTSVTANIPLVMPVEGELTANHATVVTKEGIRVQPREGAWKPVETARSRAPRQNSLDLEAKSRASEVPLAVELEDQAALGTTTVSRAWVQTWMAGSRRQDRAVFCLSSNQRNVELLVPAGVNLGSVEIWLDDKRAAAQATPEGRLVIPLSNEGGNVQRRLEALYHFTTPRPEPGPLSIELPRLGRDAWAQRVYWQLILPRREHVVLAPRSSTGEAFTGEHIWGWNGLFWGRNPVLEQAQLETWCGARRLNDVSAETNRYLYSTLGTFGRCEIHTAMRPSIVLASSGVALVLGLLLIYVPLMRHPTMLLVLGVLLCSLAALYPEPTLLAAQAAGLGIALAILAALLQRGVSRRHRPFSREASSSVFESGSTQTQFRTPVAANEAPTETIAAVPPPATPSPSPQV